MSLEFHQFAYNDDNYGVLVHDPKTGETACVDAGDAVAVMDALDVTGWRLTQLWITHHHWDHTDGLAQVKAETGCHVYGPDYVGGGAIDRLDTKLRDGDHISIAGRKVQILHTPGHTTDMINFYIPDAGVVFTGDTLFTMGCGRIFEGTADMMWESLKKLMALPKDTLVYSAHEYTLANAAFALTIDPENEALKNRADLIQRLREDGRATVPSTLALERETNPFLRASDPAIRANLKMEHATDAQVFTEIRARKDRA